MSPIQQLTLITYSQIREYEENDFLVKLSEILVAAMGGSMLK